MNSKNQPSQSQYQIMSQAQIFHLSSIFERLIVSLNKVVHILSQNIPNVDLSKFSLYSEGQLRIYHSLQSTFLDICTIIKSLGLSRIEISDQKASQMLQICAEKYLYQSLTDKSNLGDILDQILYQIQLAKSKEYQQQQFPGQSFIAQCLEILCYAIQEDKNMVLQLEQNINAQLFNYNGLQNKQNPLDNNMIFAISNKIFGNEGIFENLKDNQSQMSDRFNNLPKDFYSPSNGEKYIHSNTQAQTKQKNGQFSGNSMDAQRI
ncbi:hypothetical protein ABPG72_002637 [Tetrahymena utriculariae]